jgi:hypothetical protein
MSANPFTAGLTTRDWTGAGYLLSRPYIEGSDLRNPDEAWVYDGNAVESPIPGPQEYLHTLGTLVNGLAEAGFVIFRVEETFSSVTDPVPGTWEHLQSVAPPWLTWWTRYAPGLQLSKLR